MVVGVTVVVGMFMSAVRIVVMGVGVIEVVLILVVMIGLVIMYTIVNGLLCCRLRHFMGMVMVFVAMVMMVTFMVVMMLMDMLTGFMVMSMMVIVFMIVMMLMSLQINIHALLFLPMDRHFHMCSGDSAFYCWLRLDGKSRQAHFVHDL